MNLSTPFSLQSPNPFYRISSPTLRSCIPFTRCLSAPPRISAAFFRPPRRRRRNTLRDKNFINPVEHPQVRTPLHDLNSTNPITISNDEKIDPVVSLTSPRPELWDKLETWADTYKEDAEFWGIGTGPIFTVHQDAGGKIVRVSVNFDEISRRSSIGDLDSKIARAKVMAREIENGSRVIPPNSSIVKFEVEAMNLPELSVVDRFRLVKVYPRVGFALLCGWCVLWGVTKLFVGSGKTELTREEVEMLRRKRRARMEREELEKGRVEVIQSAVERPMGSTSRPQLDKDELMKSIVQAKASRETLMISDSSSGFNDKDRGFVDKVREIRQMARRARESEQQAESENGKDEERDDIASVLSAAKHKDVTSYSSAYGTADSVGTESDKVCVSEFQAVDIEEKEITKNSIASRRDTPDITVNVEEHKIDSRIPTEIGVENNAHCSNPSSANTEVSVNEKHIEHQMESKTTGKKNSSSSVRRKPKIIRSVKDARDYLAAKRRTTAEFLPKQEKESKTLARGNGTCVSASESVKVVTPNVDTLCEDDLESNKHSVESVDTKLQGEKNVSSQYNVPNESSSKILLQDYKGSSDYINDYRTFRTAKLDGECIHVPSPTMKDECYAFETIQASESLETLSNTSLSGGSIGLATAVMKQFSESRVYDPPELNVLSNKGHRKQKAPFEKLQDSIDGCDMKSERASAKIDWTVQKASAMVESFELDKTPDPTSLAVNSFDSSTSDLFQESANTAGELGTSPIKSVLVGSQYESDMKDSWSEASFPKDSDRADTCTDELPTTSQNTWVEKNFQQFDPIINKIGVGFKENYMVAKEKVQEQPSLRPELSELGLMEDDGELEWMNDESLRKIVFQVRDNELAGQDPFHLMDSSDQHAFFEGLERKAEKVNEKLSGLHEWIHSRIENLDYGADGISLDDPLEKIIPRWKGPSIDQDPEFLQKFNEVQTKGNSDTVNVDKQGSFDKSEDLSSPSTVSPYSPRHVRRARSSSGASTSPKTLIECSDGSSRPGKKFGKEHWQHTKKWSQDFLDVYNAETDPEIKSIMKDMGKDLDRWITEKDKKDVTDLMTRIPKKKRRYIEKKMDKLKREMEMFGAQAVVSKYKEYSDEKEEDYLWWLDLDFVLCIELYTIEDGVPNIGFYSLEMAADLELDPKQYHVIAFEDPGDSKNFCYILQAHMDMLGSGKAFVVARPPKDAFRGAKGNGFSVTVIRREKLKLNVDQTLEEVEEEIAEIGSKMYHDKIMRERSVDIRTLMKGVVRADISDKRRSKGSKRVLMKPAKS